MQIETNGQDKTVCVWLMKADQQDPGIEAWLKTQYPVWKRQNYRTAVFRSGTEDLYENTLALLRHNRTLSASQELAKDKLAKQREHES